MKPVLAAFATVIVIFGAILFLGKDRPQYYSIDRYLDAQAQRSLDSAREIQADRTWMAQEARNMAAFSDSLNHTK